MKHRTPPNASPQSTLKRADAARNRAKIIAAARSAFADADSDVSMAEISRRARVGMATLYRNFSSRRDLLEALFTDEVNAVCEAAATANAATADLAFVAWLETFFAFAMKKRHVAAELLEQSDRSDLVFTESRARVIAAGRPLLASAQRAHKIRRDVTLEQILDLVVAIAGIQGELRYITPILKTAINGLRFQPVQSSPKRAPRKIKELDIK